MRFSGFPALLTLVAPLLFGCNEPQASPSGETGRRRQAEGAASSGTPSPREAPELVSLLGRPLYATSLSSTTDEQQRLFLKSIVELAGTSEPAALVWPGRRLGYLGRMHDAVAYYSMAIERFPDYAPLYRHRGHRYISLRRFDDAIADLERALALINGLPDEVEPDGMPNEKNIPLTTTGFNITYHLALAHYLQGQFEDALTIWFSTYALEDDYDDNDVACIHWMYMSARRLNDAEAIDEKVLSLVPDSPALIENHAYFQCIRLYRGEATVEELWAAAEAGAVDFATIGYGIGNWHLYQGRPEEARAAFERVVAGDAWAAFGYIAAEVELVRMRDAAR
jgi:tetratricopeptide (TPR) repeat protein